MRERASTQDTPQQIAGNGHLTGNDEGSSELPLGRALAEPTIHPAIHRAFGALERSGARWALLRGESELASTSGDVDLLVARSDLPRVRDALAPLGYASLRAFGHGPHRFFVTYDEESDSWIKLDAVTELAYGRWHELETGAAADCLSRRRYVGLLALLARDDAFWTLLLHCMLDRGSFSVAQRERLLELADEASSAGPFAGAVEPVLPSRWRAEDLLGRVRAGDWTTLAGVAPELHASWLGRQAAGTRLRAVRNRALRRAGRTPLLRNRGLVVLVDPVDSRLAAEVGDRFFLPHRLVRAGESPAAAARSLAIARWHSAWGRLAVLERPTSGGVQPLLDRLLRSADLALGVDRTAARDRTDVATPLIWRSYARRRAGE
jgi:hypothetical protein